MANKTISADKKSLNVVIGWNSLLSLYLLVSIGTLFTTLHILNIQEETDAVGVIERLTKAETDLSKLRQQNKEFRQILCVIENIKNGTAIRFNAEYEIIRRRILNTIKEFWYFVKSQTKLLILKIRNKFDNVVLGFNTPKKELKSKLSILDNILPLGLEHIRTLLNKMDELTESDGFMKRRKEEDLELASLVEARLHYLQNPVNCKKAKKLVCDINYGCGYGCQIHHLLSCFMVAYGMQRTVILQSKGWSYNRGGWEEIFKPLSDTCNSTGDEIIYNWPGTNDSKVIFFPTTVSVLPRPPYLPLAVPEDLASRLTRLHGNPIVWWVGHVLKYILRPQPEIAAYLKDAMEKMEIKTPIVGVHVRRTDKIGSEASYHSVEEYINDVEEYYNQLELKERVSKRKIYLATDDVTVIAEAKSKYPYYHIITNPNIKETLKGDFLHLSSNLLDVLLDVQILSNTDFLICTFSSNICRLAYELMQNYSPDGATKCRSLDDVYYYSQQHYNKRRVVVLHNNETEGEIELKLGDIVHIAGNHFNGFSLGTNIRTKQTGIFPSFKVQVETDIVKFPTYSEMDYEDLA